MTDACRSVRSGSMERIHSCWMATRSTSRSSSDAGRARIASCSAGTRSPWSLLTTSLFEPKYRKKVVGDTPAARCDLIDGGRVVALLNEQLQRRVLDGLARPQLLRAT